MSGAGPVRLEDTPLAPEGEDYPRTSNLGTSKLCSRPLPEFWAFDSHYLGSWIPSAPARVTCWIPANTDEARGPQLPLCRRKPTTVLARSLDSSGPSRASRWAAASWQERWEQPLRRVRRVDGGARGRCCLRCLRCPGIHVPEGREGQGVNAVAIPVSEVGGRGQHVTSPQGTLAERCPVECCPSGQRPLPPQGWSPTSGLEDTSVFPHKPPSDFPTLPLPWPSVGPADVPWTVSHLGLGPLGLGPGLGPSQLLQLLLLRNK